MWSGLGGGEKSFSVEENSMDHVYIMGLMLRTWLKIWEFVLQQEEACFPDRTNMITYLILKKEVSYG